MPSDFKFLIIIPQLDYRGKWEGVLLNSYATLLSRINTSDALVRQSSSWAIGGCSARSVYGNVNKRMLELGVAAFVDLDYLFPATHTRLSDGGWSGTGHNRSSCSLCQGYDSWRAAVEGDVKKVPTLGKLYAPCGDAVEIPRTAQGTRPTLLPIDWK
jgi:hypothetical protein